MIHIFHFLIFFVSSVLLFHSCLATGHDRSLASLAQKWNLTDPEFSYSSLGFTLEFIVSDFILDDMMSHGIYDQDCAEGGITIPSNVLSPSLVPENVPPGVGDNPRRVNVTITINPETISKSVIYSEQQVNGQVIAEVRYCHRFMLTTVGASPIEVNFRETLVTLNIDLTDGFSIGGIDVASRDKLIQTANQVYEIEAYQCNYQNDPLTPSQLLISRSQGSVIRVCVRPDANARDDGVFMRQINSFTWERDFGGIVGRVTQEVVVDGRPAANQLSVLYCERGQEVCAFDSILMAMFYRFSGSVDGSGVASMQFGDSPGNAVSRRGLRSSAQQQHREIQEEPAAGVVEFDLNMEVLPGQNLYNKSGASQTTFWISSAGLSIFLCLFHEFF